MNLISITQQLREFIVLNECPLITQIAIHFDLGLRAKSLQNRFHIAL